MANDSEPSLLAIVAQELRAVSDLAPDRLRIMVALSGGPDSTALLVATSEIASQEEFDLIGVHINHGLRGRESDDDEAFCRSMCERLAIPFESRKICCPDAKEETLRDMRYQALTEVAEIVQAHVCLTGHTLDDQIE